MQQISTSFSVNAAGQASRFYCAQLAMLVLCSLAPVVIGCKRGESTSISPQLSQATGRKIIAQGQIMPAGGFIQLVAQPGDVADEILVAVGDQVAEGQTLVVMRSKRLHAAQRETLEAQRVEVDREQRNAIAMAERQTAAAELKILHVDSQRASLDRRAKLLGLAESQVETAKRILAQLEKVSDDPLTNEFVGALEIDRQRLAVDEAQLAFKQLQEAHLQAEEDLQWALQAAEAERESAHSLAQHARESEAVKAVALQVAALDIQDAATEVVAPGAGVILAINASKGEVSLQRPLIEMADSTQIVCEVEINEMDAPFVESGQAAIVHSRAFEKPLNGVVEKKYQMVGRPQLRSLDPLARVDYRAVTAIIRLDEASTEVAKNWLQLQVEVEIAVPQNPTPN